MCAHYTYNKDQARLRLRQKLEVFGAVPRADIRPTDLGEPGEMATSARRPATRAGQGKARLKILRGEELSVFVNCLWPALNVVNGDQETGANCVDDCRI